MHPKKFISLLITKLTYRVDIFNGVIVGTIGVRVNATNNDALIDVSVDRPACIVIMIHRRMIMMTIHMKMIIYGDLMYIEC